MINTRDKITLMGLEKLAGVGYLETLNPATRSKLVGSFDFLADAEGIYPPGHDPAKHGRTYKDPRDDGVVQMNFPYGLSEVEGRKIVDGWGLGIDLDTVPYERFLPLIRQAALQRYLQGAKWSSRHTQNPYAQMGLAKLHYFSGEGGASGYTDTLGHINSGNYAEAANEVLRTTRPNHRNQFASHRFREAAGEDLGQYHIIRAGESLSVIARRYGIDVQTLAAYNNIEDPNKINAGSIVYLPK